MRLRDNSLVYFLLALGFAIRLWAAWGTFLNPDEALHFLIANKETWAHAYRISLTTAHPPGLIFVLYFWRAMGTSEIILRLPSVIAGTIFCWFGFKWVEAMFGEAAGRIALVFFAFLPPLVALSAEVRQYALLLMFLAAAGYFLERAFSSDSAGELLVSCIALGLALLMHYSALLVAAAFGVYGLLRLLERKRPATLISVWIAGQAALAGLFATLYVTHIAKLKETASAQQAVQGWLGNSYFRPGHDNPLIFTFARSFGVFQFVFGQLAVGDLAALAFLAGIVLLLRSQATERRRSQMLALGLVLPFVVNCALALAGKYPYGGTRHSAMLAPFAIAGVSFGMATLFKQRLRQGFAVALVVIVACATLGKPHRPYIERSDQSTGHMQRAMQAIRQKVSPNDVIFGDYQTSLLLGHYLCEQSVMAITTPHPAFQSFTCDGLHVITTSPAIAIFNEENFPLALDSMTHAFQLAPGSTVWLVEAGWDIGLGNTLHRNRPDLEVDHFGRNIAMFKVTVGDNLPASADHR